MSTYTTDVLVVGAGPTGLLLAGDLAAAGIRTTVLERRTDESNWTRAFAVHARTLEQLDARGLADELVGTGRKLDSLRLFGGAQLDVSGLPTRFPFVLVTPQYETERVLEERARAEAAEIVTGVEVTGLRQDANGVDVQARTADGAEVTWRAAYVVGADGVRSTVRRALGMPFPGKSVVRSVMLADVRLRRPPTDVLTVNGTRDGFAFLVPFGDGWYRVIAWNRFRQLPDDAPLDLDEIRSVTMKVLGTDFGMHDARWLSRFHSEERQAPRYRDGRVFLAGDAAHVHSPAGGQGMNIGLQDAANLSWKLAAAVQGWAPDWLLDTYHEERHPVGRMVLRGSGALLRLVRAGSPVLRAVRNVAVRVVTRFSPVRNRVARAVSGIGVSYPAPRGAHRLVGQRAPDLGLAGDGPSRLYQALRGGQFVLVTTDPSLTTDRMFTEDQALVKGEAVTTGQAVTTEDRAGHNGRASAEDQAAPNKGQARGGLGDRLVVARPADAATPTMLVRPDGYIAWAADRDGQDGPAGHDGLAGHGDPAEHDGAAGRAALWRWLGVPGGADSPAGRTDTLAGPRSGKG